ncbi:MAG: HutD family protein [Phycisphaerales bacterium]
MTYTLDLVKKAQQHTVAWAGGTTTQIAIYPKQAEYNKRNFLWRLSSARVDLEESTFTALPGISRIIMVLAGEIRLEHQNHHTAKVKPYGQDQFSGDWTTRCFGKASDLNLMLRAGCEGKLTALFLDAQQQIAFADNGIVNSTEGTTAFYCVDGNCEMTIGKAAYLLTAWDVLLIHHYIAQEKLDFTIRNSEYNPVHIVQADMYHKTAV